MLTIACLAPLPTARAHASSALRAAMAWSVNPPVGMAWATRMRAAAETTASPPAHTAFHAQATAGRTAVKAHTVEPGHEVGEAGSAHPHSGLPPS